MINPLVVVNSNTCPLCNGKMIIIQTEINAILLGTRGEPTGEENMIFKEEYQCMQCLSIFDHEKTNGKETIYKISTRGTRLLKQYKKEQILITPRNNPFGHI